MGQFDPLNKLIMWDKDMSLTDVLCKKALLQEKQYRLSDINGLSLRIDPNGKKYWNVRVTVHGERKSESLGSYPDVSLIKGKGACI